MSLSQNPSGSDLGVDHDMDCQEKPDRLRDHDINCREDCCKDDITSRIDPSETILKRYKNRTKPSSMANLEDLADGDDPLSRAFRLTHEIRELKKKNLEVKSELKAFSKKSKKFTFELLDACKDGKNVKVLLNSDYAVKTLREAVAAKHKEFIAHRHVQQVLYKIVYEDYPARKFVSGLLMYALFTITFPIWACMFIFNWPKGFKLLQYMDTTFGKFVSHTSQFCVFVTLLVLSSLGDSHEPSAYEYLIFVFVVAMFLQQTHKIWKERSCYFYKWWNCVLIAMLMGFLASGLLWVIGSSAIGGWSAAKLASHWDLAGHKILLLANSLFSISSVISVLYLGSLCQVNSVFGPLQLSTLRMFKDIGKFLTIFLGVFFAFTVGVRNLYSYNRSLQVEYTNSNNSTAYNMEDELSTFAEAWQVMFWALFDQTNIEKFEATHPRFRITSNTGKFLFAIYLITAVLVGINMLIAMMNNSFEYVAADKDRLNWKMSRTAMWLEFADKDDYLLPPPYNVLHFPISYVCKKWKERKARSKDPEKMEMNNIDKDGEKKKLTDPDHKKILQEIADRYLKNKPKESEENGQEELVYESNV